jgi:hypothetical protein
MMMATFARFLQLVTSFLRLWTMLAMPADGSLQVLFGSVNPPLAFAIVISVIRLGWNRTREKTDSNERCDRQFGSQQDLLHKSPSSSN